MAVDRRRASRRRRRAARPPRASLSCSSSIRCDAPAPPARPTAARAPGRGGRRARAAPAPPARGAAARRSARSTRASLQCRSSSTSTSALGSASSSSSAAHRAVRAVALVGDGATVARRSAQRGQDAGQLGQQLGVPAVVARVLRGDVGVERVDPDAERQVALELRRRAGQHEVAALLRALAQLARAAASCRSPARPRALRHAAPPLREGVQRRLEPARARARARPSVRALEPIAELRRLPVLAVQGSGSGVRPRCSGGRCERRLPACSRHLNQRRRHATVTKHRSAGRALERPAPQDGDHRMDRLRRPGLHGRRQGRHRDSSPQERVRRRRSGTRRQDRRRTPTPRASTRSVLIQSKKLKTDDPEFRAVVADVIQRLEDDEGVTEITEPLRQGRAGGAISDDGHSALVSFEIPGDADGRRGARHGRGRRRSLQTEAAQKAHPDFSVEQFGDGSSEEEFKEIFNERPRRRPTIDVAADHADPAGARVRHAGRGGHPAAAGDHRRRRHDGPRRPAQPARARRGVDQPRHPADRPGRRRGLRAVLPAPGARGARRRAQQGGGDRGGRRDLRPRGARLRHHGDDRHGRHVLRRSATFTSFATGTIVVVAVAMLGSLTVLPAVLSLLGDRIEKGRVPGLGRSKRGGRDRHLVAHRGPRAAPPAAVGGPGHALLRGAGDPGAAAWTSAPRAPRPRCRRTSRSCRRSTACRRRSRARPRRSSVVIKAQGRDGAGRHGRASRSSSRPRRSTGPVPVERRRASTSTPTRRSRRSSSRSPATARTTSRTRRSTCSATTSCPRRSASVDGVEAYVGGGTAADADFTDTLKSNIPLRVRRSCSRRRSCCCWSRSARSWSRSRRSC